MKNHCSYYDIAVLLLTLDSNAVTMTNNSLAVYEYVIITYLRVGRMSNIKVLYVGIESKIERRVFRALEMSKYASGFNFETARMSNKCAPTYLSFFVSANLIFLFFGLKLFQTQDIMMRIILSCSQIT